MEDPVLGEAARSAMFLAASQIPVGTPLTTGRVLDALVRVDARNEWERLWLHSGEPEALHLADAPDAGAVSPAASWEGLPLSKDMQTALATSRRICDAYDMGPASSGVLALALVADPSSGAARAICQYGLEHAELLKIVQSDLIGTGLGGLESLLSATPPRRDSVSHDRLNSAATIIFRATARATSRTADEQDVLMALYSDTSSAEVLRHLGLDQKVVEAFEQPMRATGLRPVTDLDLDEGPPEAASPLSLLAKLGESPSPGLSLFFRLAGMDGKDICVEAAQAMAEQAGRRRNPSTGLVVLGLVNVILSLLITALLLVDAVGPGTLWELCLIPLIWLGYPRWPTVVPLLAVIPLALAVTPVVGGLQLAAAVADWLQARAEKREIIARTGVIISYRVARRVALRRLARGRRSLAVRQLIRLRFMGPRIIRNATRAGANAA